MAVTQSNIYTHSGDQSNEGNLISYLIIFTLHHTITYTPALHTLTHTHNQLAAAKPEIKASVTDVISGYICDRKREREQNKQM